MQDKLSLPADLARAIHAERKRRRLKATDIAAHSGRARSLLYRLERGEDVSVGALFDILRAMGLALRLEEGGVPTLAEMRRRFAADEDESAADAS